MTGHLSSAAITSASASRSATVVNAAVTRSNFARRRLPIKRRGMKTGIIEALLAQQRSVVDFEVSRELLWKLSGEILAFDHRHLTEQALYVSGADPCGHVLLRLHFPIDQSDRNQVRQAMIGLFLGSHGVLFALLAATDDPVRDREGLEPYGADRVNKKTPAVRECRERRRSQAVRGSRHYASLRS